MPPPVELLVTDQAEVRLVDEGRGLERLPGTLRGDARGGELAQFLVDEREQVGGSVAIAGRGGIENAGHVGHNDRAYQLMRASRL
jgi:hypothetical protein